MIEVCIFNYAYYGYSLIEYQFKLEGWPEALANIAWWEFAL